MRPIDSYMIIFSSSIKDLPSQKCLFFMLPRLKYYRSISLGKGTLSWEGVPSKTAGFLKKTRPTIKVVPLKTSWFLRAESWNKADDLKPSAYLHIVGVCKYPSVWKELNYTDFQTKESYILLPFSRPSSSVQSKTNCSREEHVSKGNNNNVQ